MQTSVQHPSAAASSSLSSLPVSPIRSATTPNIEASSSSTSTIVPSTKTVDKTPSPDGNDLIDDLSDDIEMHEGEADGEADGPVKGARSADEGGEDEEDDEREANGLAGDESEGSDSEEDEEEDEEDEDSGDESEDLDGTPDIIAVSGPNGELPVHMESVKSEPTDPEVTATSSTSQPEPAAVNELVPKKKIKRRRSPSEDEDLPPPPPPMRTIRLERPLPQPGALGWFDTLDWDVSQEAEEKGMYDPRNGGEDVQTSDPLSGVALPGKDMNLPPEIPAVVGDGGGVLGSEMSPEEIARRIDARHAEREKPKKSKRIQRKKIDYDLEDPFIDDSEALIDAPTHYQRPEKEGFFVHQGQVPLKVLEVSPVKTKSRNQPRPKAGPSSSAAEYPHRPRQSLSSLAAATLPPSTPDINLGSQMSPIKVDSDSEEDVMVPKDEAGPSRLNGARTPERTIPVVRISVPPLDRNLYKSAPKDADLLPPYTKLPVELANRLMTVRQASDKFPWRPEEKQKFPDHIRPLLRKVGEAAYQADLFPVTPEDKQGNELFDMLPGVLPYNRFTLSKLITKLCYDGFKSWIQKCENLGVEKLKELVQGDENGWVQKYEEAMATWSQEMEEWNEKHIQGPNGATTTEPTREPEVIDVDAEDAEPSPAADGNTKPREPAKRFQWTPEMRELLGQLLDNMQTMVDLNKRMEDLKAPFEGQTHDAWYKRDLYRKICECFPDGFMTTSTVSRESSKLKKKAQNVEA